MPHFFQFSRNGRHANAFGQMKKKKCKAPNGSTMNRICKRFSDVGSLNMNYAGVEPFNWEMLLFEPMGDFIPEAVELFCYMDDTNLTNLIEASEMNDMMERQDRTRYEILRDQIVSDIVRRFGSLEAVYPSIVRFLFTGENLDKQSHKQMFWRVFGDMAVAALEKNLIACRACHNCGMLSPIWQKDHGCPKQRKGIVVCVDCGKVVDRSGPKQCRCMDCQKEYRRLYAAARWKKMSKSASSQNAA